MSGNTISSSAFNTLETDIGTEITNSLDRGGRSAMTAALPMGNNKITGLADPVALQDAATRNYLLQSDQQAVAQSYTNTGTADALTCAGTPTVTALTAGMTFFIRALAPNATTTPTFAPDAIAAATIVKGAGQALAAGDIAGAGYWASLTYDLTLTKWVLNNPATGIIAPPASLGFFKNLSIKVATNTTVAVAADSIVTSNGSTFQATALSGTINLGTNGVANALDAGTIAIDTWYAIWAIAKPDGTTAGLASVSFTAPTLPTGYTFKARLGAVRTIHASATLFGTWQLGRQASYIVGLAQTSVLPLMGSGIAGTLPSVFATISVSSFVPTTASRIRVVAGSADNQGLIFLAPNSSYAAGNPAQGVIAMVSNLGALSTQQTDFMLESSNIYWNSNRSSCFISCYGWEDNL